MSVQIKGICESLASAEDSQEKLGSFGVGWKNILLDYDSENMSKSPHADILQGQYPRFAGVADLNTKRQEIHKVNSADRSKKPENKE